MSYILDALRKADRQRQRAARVPTLDTVHQSPPPARRRWWLWAIAAALALNAAVLVLALRPDSPVVAPATVAPQRNLPPREPAGRVAPAAAPPQSDRPGGGATARPAPGAPRAAPPATASAVPAPSGSPAASPLGPDLPAEASTVPPPPQAALVPAGPASASPARAPGPRPSDGAPATATTPAPSPPGSAPPTPPRAGPADAARALREAMSKMTLDVLVYADHEADRLVFINGRKYVEGQRVDEKFLLEAITEEGAILSEGGERLLLRPRVNPYPPSTQRGVGR